MKKRTGILVFILSIISFITIADSVQAAVNDDLNLVSDISWDKETVFPGVDTAIEVKYTNEGTSQIPDDAEVKFHIEVREIGLGKNNEPIVVRQSEEIDVPDARGKGPGQSFSVSTEITAPPEGNYNLVAILNVHNQASIEDSELFGVKSALPPGLSRLFAGLGMFAAVMAIMAAGTEVVIETVKFFFGLKQKVTALEALDMLKEQLPGQLAELGVNRQSQGKIDNLFSGLNQTLQPLATASEVYKAVQNGRFGMAFANMKTLEKDLRELQNQLKGTDGDKKKILEDQIETKFTEMKQIARTGAVQALTELGKTFHLEQSAVTQVEKTLDKLTDGITLKKIITATDYTAELVANILREIHMKGSEWTANWLKTQVDTYLTEGRSKVVDLLHDNVVPVLKDVGFSETNIQEMEDELVAQIDGLQVQLQEKTTTYTMAVRNLLQAVEEKRDDMQSPARKIWRWLREINQLSFWATLLGVILGIAVIVAAFYLPIPVSWPIVLVRAGIGTAGILVAILISWFGRSMKPSLGKGFADIEIFINKIRGREEEEEKLGQVETGIQEEIDQIGPTNLAAVVLKREDKHRDEEATRIRMLRIISIFVGGILAYMLQIDALQLLEEALPGAAKINITLANAGELHRFWPMLNYDLTAGIILTGLAAGAGSKFWRDLLSRLQATKEQAESAASLLRKTRSAIDLDEQ